MLCTEMGKRLDTHSKQSLTLGRAATIHTCKVAAKTRHIANQFAKPGIGKMV